jgi:hypothetical protein
VRNNIILDANLLLLLLVGLASPVYIARHRRLRAYSEPDFELLKELLAPASKIVVTPNTLTETSNLAGQIAEPARSHIYAEFRALFGNALIEERYLEAKVVVQRTEFTQLGLTDCTLLDLLKEPHTLLTADLDLFVAASKQGLRAENFNWHRDRIFG